MKLEVPISEEWFRDQVERSIEKHEVDASPDKVIGYIKNEVEDELNGDPELGVAVQEIIDDRIMRMSE